MTGNSTVFEVIGVDMVVQEDVAVVATADDGDGVDGVDSIYKYRCQRITFSVLQMSSAPAVASNPKPRRGYIIRRIG